MQKQADRGQRRPRVYDFGADGRFRSDAKQIDAIKRLDQLVLAQRARPSVSTWKPCSRSDCAAKGWMFSNSSALGMCLQY
jgi:hypothetical protein